MNVLLIYIKMTHKQGALELSVNVIVILILAIVMLGLGLGFVKGMFGKVSVSFEEQISREPEPPTPTTDTIISLSRENIKANSGETEIIKVKVLNPTDSDWDRRPDLYGGFSGCGASDRICYIDNDNGCDGESDPDCAGDTSRSCETDTICLINKDSGPNADPEDGVERICPPGWGLEADDCRTQLFPGIDLLVKCDNGLQINKVSDTKIILSGEIETFTTIIQIKKGVKGSFLCNMGLFGDVFQTLKKI
jgi:hypothetical protein